MSSGDEGLLTLTIKMRVSPEPGSGQELANLMRRYREALNYAIKLVIENKALSLAKPINCCTAFLKRGMVFHLKLLRTATGKRSRLQNPG